MRPTTASPASALSLSLLGLRRGEVVAEAWDSFTIAITGGTRAYRTAHGEATITESEDENGPQGLRLKIIR